MCSSGPSALVIHFLFFLHCPALPELLSRLALANLVRVTGMGGHKLRADEEFTTKLQAGELC